MTARTVASPPTVVQRRPSWRPALGAPRRVFDTTFSGVGLTMAAWFFALSLVPSLLPRAAMVQGIVSGVTVMIGYGIGAGTQALWRYLGIPGVPGRARRVLVAIFVGLGLWAAVFTGWRQVGWQNEIRTLYGMEPASPTVWPVILGLTAALAVLLLVVGRGLRLLFRTVFRLARAAPAPPRRGRRRLGRAPRAHLVAVHRRHRQRLLRRRQQHLRAARHAHRRGHEPTRRCPSARAARSRSSSWELLGRQGRYFVGGGPTVAELDAVNGGGAKEPIRVYAGLQSADTVQGRADLVLAELKRTGAFDRKVLVVATTTGMGFLDQNGTDPLEYLWNGDTAIAGVQYSYLPSWISLLADQEAVVETSRVVFETVRQYWATLPAASRPKLYLYGLSLGSIGVESILSSVNIVNEPIDGALMVGPPFVNDMHARLEADRDAGSPAYLPVYEQGRTVRFTAEQNGLDRGEPGRGARPASSTSSTRATPSSSSRRPGVHLARVAQGRRAGSRRLAADGLVPARDDVAGAARPAGRRQHPDGLRPPLLGHGQPRVLGRP